MEFEVDQITLQSTLSLASSIADPRSTMPVLGNVLVQTDGDDNVVCSATDMRVFLTDRFEAKVKKQGAICVGVRHMSGLVKTLTGESVQLEGLDNHWVRILSGQSEFKLMGVPQHDFPEFPSADDIEFTSVPGKVLSALIQRTVFSVSTDEARVNLNGALFECDGKIATMVSTDAHRLTKLSVDFAGPDLSDRGGVVIPRKGLLEIRRVLERINGHVNLGIGDEHLFIKSDRVLLAVKLTSVGFPPYQKVIPSSHKRAIEVDRHELVAMLKQAEVLAPEKTATIRVELGKGKLQLTSDNPDLGVGHQEIEVDYDGESIAAGFNARYLIEALDALGEDKARLEFQGELDPCVIRSTDKADYLAVVMPMRI